MTDKFAKLSGTVVSFFKIGGTNGPQWKVVGTNQIEARDAADAAFARVKVDTPVDPEDATPKFYVDNGVLGSPVLPAPRVRQLQPANFTTGQLRDGQAVDCYGTLVVSITDLPEILRLNADYKCQIELGRYVGQRRKGNGKIMPAGFYHPSPWVGGATAPGSGGTRGGSQSLPGGAIDRPSEWAVFGMGFGGSLLLPSAQVFAPWAQKLKVFDLNGNAVESLDFAFRPRRNNSRPPGSKPNTLTGVFAFRYAFYDITSGTGGRWVSGPWSERVYARPKGYPLGRYPVGTFPALNTVLPDRASFRELSFSIGSRVR